MNPLPKPDDVVWTKVRHLGGEQWIRVVVEFVYVPDRTCAVHALFPGDAQERVWSVHSDNLRAEEPTFDEIDATYDGGEEFCPA